MPYNHTSIEQKWQKFWEENQTFKTENPVSGTPFVKGDKGDLVSEKNPQSLRDSSFTKELQKPKKYILDMFPYPSGAGLHVGHPKGYTATDIVSRFYHAKGYNVLHPMGFDAFGLPAENYAIKTGTHPATTTAQNIETFISQLKNLGFSYDWNRMVDTTDPEYYKWTQWIFLELFKRGLAYEQDLPINYCPSCKTGLANEEVLSDNTCDRCGTRVERRPIRQWVLRITEYAERLISDLDGLDWPEGIKEMQRNWIGKNKGVKYSLKVKDTDITIQTYSTHFEAFYADTFAVIAPDHGLLPKIVDGIENKDEILSFAQRINNQKVGGGYKEVTDHEGIFTGRYLIDPITKSELPLWISSYALSDYGTGIIKCSAHDERDFNFAKKYNLPLRVVMLPKDAPLQEKRKIENFEYCYNDFAGAILSLPEEFASRNPHEAHNDIIQYLVTNNFAEESTQYKLRDWLFSRQRYWGEPIPLIHISHEDYAKLPRIGDTKKSGDSYSHEGEGVTRNGDTAKFPLSMESIVKTAKKVKKKSKKIPLSSVYTKCDTAKGSIIFNGNHISRHFGSKDRKERDFRSVFGFTIGSYLDDLIYTSDTVGYIMIREYLFKVILKETSPKNYIVKTYYPTKNKYSGPLQGIHSASILIKSDSEYLMIGNKEFSKVYDGINGKIIIDSRLPLTLPEVERYEPAGDGQSPLATVPSFVNIKLADNLTGKRETNTMPQWGGSCWYYLRYMDSKNPDALASKDALDYWGSVDEYVGGAEHAVLHLLYARFWHKVLYDAGIVPTKEPFQKLTNVGMILAYAYERQDGGLVAVDLVEERDGKFFEKETGKEVKQVVAKMSKSLKNVINPNDIVHEYGADTLRLYEMNMAGFTDTAPWNPEAITGVRRFLDKAYSAFLDGKNIAKDDMKAMKLLHKTIKKVGEDIVGYKFNTAISSLMILLGGGIPTDAEFAREWKEAFAILLHPFAPHMAEELYQTLGKNQSIYEATWPEYDDFMLVDDEVTIAIQVNGKLRGTLNCFNGVAQEEVSALAHENPDIAKWFEGKTLVKEIFIPNKMLSIVVKD